MVVSMKALLAAAALLAAPPATPSPTPPKAAELTSFLQLVQGEPERLAGVNVRWRVAEFIAEHASKEESEALGPDARGYRRFRVLPSARPKSLDDVVVYFKENRVMLVAATQTRAIDDAGSWSQLVAHLADSLGPASFLTYADRAKMLQSFALGEKGKALKLREVAEWHTDTADVGALWLEDTWAKKRTYVLTVLNRAPAASMLTKSPAAFGPLQRTETLPPIATLGGA